MIDTITIAVDGMAVGTVITVADIPELMNDKINLQVEKEELVLRIIGKKHSAVKVTEQDAQ